MSSMSSKNYLQYLSSRNSGVAIDKRKLSPRNRAILDSEGITNFTDLSGLGCKPVLEPRVRRNQALGEKQFTSTTCNAGMTIGPDRNDYITSGYGGEGIGGAASIGLTAGLGGAYGMECTPDGTPVLTNPSWTVDAARLELSQRTDIDSNLQIPTSAGPEARGGSGVGIKADAVRLVSRGDGGIRLVAGVDVRDSQGGKILQDTGVELIGGCGDDPPQRMVKGENLVEALETMTSQTADLREIVNSFIKYQRGFNNQIMSHNHNSPFYALTTAPSFTLLFDGFKSMFQLTAESEGGCISSIVNQSMDKNNYFSPIGASYLLSALNRTN